MLWFKGGIQYMSSKKYEIDMLSGNYVRLLAKFAFPLMLSSILQLLFNAADIAVVGRFAGDTALAAVSSTSALVNLCVNLFIGLSVGTNIITARMIGENHTEGIHKVVHTSVAMGILYGTIVAVFGIFFAGTMLQMMGNPENVIDQATLYMQIYFLGLPANLVYNFGAAALRSKGDTRRPLYFLFIAGAVNVLLNLFFVIVFHLDVAGVALATIASQFISAFLVLRCLNRETDYLKFSFKDCRIDMPTMVEVLKIGVPCGLQGTVFSISNVVIQSTINSFGAVIMAANGAASNIEGFIFTAANAFSQAGQTFIGQNYGAKKLRNIYTVSILTIAYILGLGIIMSFLIYHFGPFLLKFYTSSPEVIEAGMVRMRYVSRFCFIDTMMGCFSAILRGVGYVTLPTVNTLIMVCGFRLLYIATLFKTNPVITNLYIVYPISWILTVAVHIITCIAVRKKVQAHCEN